MSTFLIMKTRLLKKFHNDLKIITFTTEFETINEVFKNLAYLYFISLLKRILSQFFIFVFNGQNQTKT